MALSGCLEREVEQPKVQAAQVKSVAPEAPKPEFWLAPIEKFKFAPAAPQWNGEFLDLTANAPQRRRPGALPLLGIYSGSAPVPLDMRSLVSQLTSAIGALPDSLTPTLVALQEARTPQDRNAAVAAFGPALKQALEPYHRVSYVRFSLPTDRLFHAAGVDYDASRQGFAPNTGLFDSPTVDSLSGEVRRVKMDLSAQYGATLVLSNPEVFRFLPVKNPEDAGIILEVLRQADSTRFRFDIYGEVRGAIFNESTIDHHVVIKLRKLELVDIEQDRALASYTLR